MGIVAILMYTRAGVGGVGEVCDPKEATERSQYAL